MHAMYPQPQSSQRMRVVCVRLDLCAHQKAVVQALLNLKGGGQNVKEGTVPRYVALSENPALTRKHSLRFALNSIN